MSSLLGMNGGSDFDLTPGLIAHYLLNNNADDSFGTFDGTPIDVDFQGDVAEFNGTTTQIAYPSLGLNGSFTFNFWFYSNDVTVEQRNEYNDSTDDLYLMSRITTSSKFFVNFRDASGYPSIESTTTLTNNTLYMVTITYTEGGNMELFLNGSSEGTVAIGIGIIGTGTVARVIGSTRNSTLFWDGAISNVRIYSDVKGQAFIDALFAEGYYPKPLPLPTTEGLIAHYPLTGTAEDTTGNYDGTEVSNTYVNDAEFGSVLSLTGSPSQIGLDILVPALSSYPFTITAWLYVDGTNNPTIVINDYTVDDKGLFVGYSTTDQVFYMGYYDGAYTNLNEKAETVVGWYFIECLFEDNNFKMSVNDVLVSTNQGSYPMISPINAVRIGKLYRPTAVHYTGLISDVRFYDRGITQQEITDIYNYEKNFRPIAIDEGLIAYYPLANNPLDNYYNQYDGSDTATVTRDGQSSYYPPTTRTTLGSRRLPRIYTYTFSFWMKKGHDLGESFIFVLNYRWSDTNSYSSGLRIQAVPATNQIFIGINNANTSSVNAYYCTQTYDRDKFEHITITFNSGYIEFYVNGVFSNAVQGTNPYWSSQSSSQQTDDAIAGGYLPSHSRTYLFDGNLAKFRIYSKAISAEQVAVIYNTEKGDFE